MPDKPNDNHFLMVLTRQRGGDCLEELSARLREAGKQVRATGRKATVKLELTVAPLKSSWPESGFSISDSVSVKLPPVERDISVVYIDEEGAFSRQDPRQRELPLEAVTGGAPAQPAGVITLPQQASA